jgi:hypothetical protein
MVSKSLAWLCEEPQHSFTLSKFLRRGWPELASFLLLPKLLELGRAARLVERTIFVGGMAGFVFYGGPAGERSLAEDKSEFNDHCGPRGVIAILPQVALAVG